MIIRNLEPGDSDYLRDESRRIGRADGIGIPRSDSELIALLESAERSGMVLTLQGARTGITAGAVPNGGSILSLSAMDQIIGAGLTDGIPVVRVQPGVRLADLNRVIAALPASLPTLPDMQPLPVRENGWRFTPDPTETSASLGGMAACNASGARSLGHGPTRAHVHRARIVLVDGDCLTLTRGVERAVGNYFSLQTHHQRIIEGELPTLPMPATKNAAGYYCAENMDLLDLFIGSEGTLGIFAELDLQLRPAPRHIWGLVAFSPSEAAVIPLVADLRNERFRPVALEYFDHHALNLLRAHKTAGLPDLDAEHHCAVYAEFEDDDDDRLATILETVCDVLSANGIHPDQAWVATQPRDLAVLKTFRHAVPEQVNRRIDEIRRTEPGITKLGTDLAVPDARLADMLARYRTDLERESFESVIFGHIGNNHLHVNILPDTLAAYERAHRLYLTWARLAAEWGGSVAAEHGLGKIKAHLLELMYGHDPVERMRDLKRRFDPRQRLNRGNLFLEDGTDPARN